MAVAQLTCRHMTTCYIYWATWSFFQASSSYYVTLCCSGEHTSFFNVDASILYYYASTPIPCKFKLITIICLFLNRFLVNSSPHGFFSLSSLPYYLNHFHFTCMSLHYSIIPIQSVAIDFSKIHWLRILWACFQEGFKVGTISIWKYSY